MVFILLQRGDPAALSLAESLALQVLSEGYGAGYFGPRVFALCCLARIRLAAGRPEEGRQYSGQAVALMESADNHDTRLDPRVYFTHFTALQTMGDDAASAFLQRARAALYCRAQTLPPRLRNSYLRRVKENWEICREVHK